ncbi:hypothetical protein GW17_00056636, partial [Ensete ventricosum]
CSYSRPDTGKVGTPHLQTHASLQVQRAWWEGTAVCRPPQSSSESPLIQISSHSVLRRPRGGRASAHEPEPANAFSANLKAGRIC